MNVEGLDNIYKMNMHTEDYNNPTMDGNLSWHSINSCTSDLEE